ncbi:hypothetical protein V8J88_21465 [Massilia sp. W12]|uniref:hypothetical protein n=1 Tax=Massilia sp. W12 TaxID=3126507 RepID=UPI0030CF1430
MIVTTFEAKCSNCSETSFFPELGDFAYGDFIFYGEGGSAFGYFSAHGNSAWAVIEALIPASGTGNQSGAKHEQLIQAACAAMADPISNQTLSNRRRCPHCGSMSFEYWSGAQGQKMDVRQVEHVRFLALSREAQKKALNAYIATL